MIFTRTPSYASEVAIKSSVIETRYGDGYSQRLLDGVNAQRQAWNCQFDVRADTDADSMMEFFYEHAARSFEWIAPRAASAKRYIAKEPSRVFVGPNVSAVKVTFEQVFDTA